MVWNSCFYNVLVLSVLEFVLSQCFLFLSVLALQKLKMNCRPQLLFSCVRAFETLENPENRDGPQKTDIFAEKPPPSYPNSPFFAPCSKNISHGKERKKAQSVKLFFEKQTFENPHFGPNSNQEGMISVAPFLPGGNIHTFLCHRRQQVTRHLNSPDLDYTKRRLA